MGNTALGCTQLSMHFTLAVVSGNNQQIVII